MQALTMSSEAATRSTADFVARVHVSLNVRDVEASVRFYESFFGVPAHKRRPGYANFAVAEPPIKLALNEVAPTAGAGSLSHLGIEMPSTAQVAAIRDRLKADGLASFDEGDTVCCWARQDKVWATDPDGNAWEVYVLLDEMDELADDHFGPGGIARDAESCCCEVVENLRSETCCP